MWGKNNGQETEDTAAAMPSESKMRPQLVSDRMGRSIKPSGEGCGEPLWLFETWRGRGICNGHELRVYGCVSNQPADGLDGWRILVPNHRQNRQLLSVGSAPFCGC